MMGRTAGQNNNMVNATDFNIGDVVKLVSQDLAANHVGVVTHVLPKSNTVNIQWAWGNKSESPETLMKVPKDWYPLTVSKDTSYSTWETDKSEKMFGKLPSNRRAFVATKIALKFDEKVSTLVDEVSQLHHRNLTSLQSYLRISAKYANSISDEVLKEVIAEVYGE
jgi:hypothetical protein